MRQINTGNVLPLYKADNLVSDKVWQPSMRHYVNGSFDFLPLQYVHDTNLDLTFYVKDVADDAIIGSLSNVVKRVTNDGKSIHTYTGVSGMIGISCKLYQILIVDDFTDNTIAVSEYILAKNDWKCTITFTNPTDIGDIMYQTGFTQKIYFDPYEDFPITDEANEVEINLTGQEILTSYRQVESRVLAYDGVLDSQLSAFQRVQGHETITLTEVEPAQTTTIKRLRFEYDTNESKTSVGRFIFQTNFVDETICGVNKYILT